MPLSVAVRSSVSISVLGVSVHICMYIYVSRTQSYIQEHIILTTLAFVIYSYTCVYIYIYTQVTIGIMSKYMQIHTCVYSRTKPVTTIQ